MERQKWVDACKAIAIIAVVIGHLEYNYPEVGLFPFSTILAWLWHVPVFFMIGGFFLNDVKLAKPVTFIKGKIKSLYLLIMYLYIPAIVLHNVLLNIGFYDTSLEYGGKYVSHWGVTQFIKGLAETIFLAGREPILGAMWFVYVLFIALCVISIVTYTSNLLFGGRFSKELRFSTLLLGAVISNILTNVFEFTIPRFNNVFTAAWLIYVGMLLIQKYKIAFDNKFLLVISLIVFYSSAVLTGDVHLNRNEYRDIVSLTISSLSALYIIAFISKKCRGRLLSILSIIGRDSFYIMGLHFIAFKLGSIILNQFGSNKNLAVLNPNCNNMVEFIYYTICGVGFSLLAIFLFRRIKAFLLGLWKSEQI